MHYKSCWLSALIPCCFCMQAVDDCTTVAAIFKLLEGFEGLLEREAIAGELERKYLELLAAFSVDIRQVS